MARLGLDDYGSGPGAERGKNEVEADNSVISRAAEIDLWFECGSDHLHGDDCSNFVLGLMYHLHSKRDVLAGYERIRRENFQVQPPLFGTALEIVRDYFVEVQTPSCSADRCRGLRGR